MKRDYKKEYQNGKQKTIDQAIQFQNSFTETSLSWNEIIIITNSLTTSAKKYGLVKEFQENGII